MESRRRQTRFQVVLAILALTACATLLLSLQPPVRATSTAPGGVSAHARPVRVELRSGSAPLSRSGPGDIWLIADGIEHRLTSDGGYKMQPQLSPDGAQVAFEAADARPASPMGGFAISRERIKIVDLAGALVREFLIVDANVRQACNAVLEFGWIDEHRVGVNCHIDPDNEEYIVLDTRTGQRSASYLVACCLLEWSPDGSKVAYTGAIPHFGSPQEKSSRVEVNGLEVFPRRRPHGIIHEIDSPLAWSPDSRRIAFLDVVMPGERVYLVIAGEQEKPVMIAAPFELREGDDPRLSWDDANTVRVTIDDDAWTLDAATGEWVDAPALNQAYVVISPRGVTPLTAFLPM